MKKQNKVSMYNASRSRWQEQLSALTTRIITFVSKSQLLEEAEKTAEKVIGLFAPGVSRAYVENFKNSYIAYVHMFPKRETALASYLTHNPDDAFAKQLVSLPVRLLQCIDYSEETYTLKDLHTEENFVVSSKENMQPWAIQFAIVCPEEHGVQFVFRHVAFSPKVLREDVLELSETERREQLLSRMETSIKVTPTTDEEIIDVFSYTFNVKVADFERYIENSELWFIEESEDESLYHFATVAYEYSDSLIEKPMHIQSIDGTAIFDGDTATFTTVVPGVTQLFEQWANSVGLEPSEVAVEKLSVPAYSTQSKHYAFSSDGQFNQTMALISQSAITLRATEAQPTLEMRSLVELLNNGETEAVEQFLKEQEFEYFPHTFPMSADFNAIRKDRGFEKSPFVIGENRTSHLSLLYNVNIQTEEVSAVAPTLVDQLATFQQEKTENKSAATQNKY
ncbi:MAG: hypothetical protein ACRCWQ_13935, partial [Bacilli bacterium]